MSETERIANLLDDLYKNDPWIEVNLTGTLKDISAEKAAKKIAPGLNSIWQIVNHLINWRLTVLKRVKGEAASSPGDNFFSEVNDTSEKAWKETLQRLENSQQQWLQFLKEFDEKNFSNKYPGNQMTWYEHIHG